MYVHRPLVAAALLAALAVPLFVFSLTGPWFSWEGEQFVKWVAGAAAIGLLVAAGSYHQVWEKRRAWVQRDNITRIGG